MSWDKILTTTFACKMSCFRQNLSNCLVTATNPLALKQQPGFLLTAELEQRDGPVVSAGIGFESQRCPKERGYTYAAKDTRGIHEEKLKGRLYQ